MKITQIGQKLVYPGHGIMVVAGLQTRESTNVAILKALDGHTTMVCPLGESLPEGVRKLVTVDEIQDIFARMTKRFKVDASDSWSKRYHLHANAVAGGNLHLVAEVYRNIELLKIQRGDLSFGERHLQTRALGLLTFEIAHVMRLTDDQVHVLIEACFTDLR